MTRWFPDTCACVVDYDDNLKVTAVVKKCAKHANTADDASHFETVLAHNRKKNGVYSAVVDQLSSVGSTADSLVVLYDHADDLHVSGSGLSLADQAAIEGKISPTLGSSALRFVN
jgi:hypothetical protein